ncbi:MAG: hypothetical protein HY069_04240 [Chlamydiia bacterium]|nr:hypothetical protein [Chlamydiia bacterium]
MLVGRACAAQPSVAPKGALLRYDFALRSESNGWLMHSQLRARVVSQYEEPIPVKGFRRFWGLFWPLFDSKLGGNILGVDIYLSEFKSWEFGNAGAPDLKKLSDVEAAQLD